MGLQFHDGFMAETLLFRSSGKVVASLPRFISTAPRQDGIWGWTRMDSERAGWSLGSNAYVITDESASVSTANSMAGISCLGRKRILGAVEL
ncbi:tail protein [Pseudomonas phage WP1]